MIAILQHFVPDINLELDGLKALGAELGVVGPAPPPSAQTPMRSLPPSLERAYGQIAESSSNQSEYMSGRSESPTSVVAEEDEQQINKDPAISPNAEMSHPSSPILTRNFSSLISLTLDDNQHSVPSQTTAPDGYFSSLTFGTLRDRVQADTYVEKYFNDINDVIWVLSYDAFMSWYRDYDPNIPLEVTKQAILSLVFAFGAIGECNDEGDAYFSYAQRTIGLVLQKGGLEVIQVFILMVHFL